MQCKYKEFLKFPHIVEVSLGYHIKALWTAINSSIIIAVLVLEAKLLFEKLFVCLSVCTLIRNNFRALNFMN